MAHYDLVILGSGSTAFAAALRAQELGKTAVMAEMRTLGGTCVNRGCLPSKNLIEAGRILHEARNPRYRGIEPTEPRYDFRQLVAQKDEVVHGYRDRKYRSLLGGQFDVLDGFARFADARTVEVGDQRITGGAFLVATGARPFIPVIEGLGQIPYLTSDLLSANEKEELADCPSSLLILGGGYIALELGQMFRRFGSKVTILERGPQILHRGYEPETGQAIHGILAEEGIEIVTGVTVRRFRREGCEIVAEVDSTSGPRELRAEHLLVATGRRPNTEGIGLDAAGVEIDHQGAVRVDRTLRTSVPHIFAAGDVIGSQHGNQNATPVGSHDGRIAAENALGMPARQVDHRVVPRVIFTDPQVAVVGLTEAEAVQRGHRCWCRPVPMSLVPRAGAIHDERGFVKFVADADTNEVLGVTMVGRDAGEVIHEAAMAMRFRAKLEDFVDLLHVYPTMAEALKIGAISRFKDPAKLSCCAE